MDFNFENLTKIIPFLSDPFGFPLFTDILSTPTKPKTRGDVQAWNKLFEKLGKPDRFASEPTGYTYTPDTTNSDKSSKYIINIIASKNDNKDKNKNDLFIYTILGLIVVAIVIALFY